MLDDLGLIDHDRRAPGKRGWQSAARAKPELGEAVSELFKSEPLVAARPHEPIVLRDKHGKLTDYSETREAGWMRKRLDEINEGIASAGLPSAIRAPVVRIFNRDFGRGGRFYAMGGAWQVLSEDARGRIQIDDEPMVEMDFRCLHPSMLYVKESIPVPADAYDLPPWPRDLVKHVLLVLINAPSRRIAQSAIAHCEAMADVALPGTNEASRNAGRIIKDVAALHRPIDAAFGTDAGAKLMRLDSEIAEAVMLDMLKRGIVVLPVHDSFLAPASKSSELEQAMMEAAERKTGTRLLVSLK
ncbi:MAG: hypothetical protein AAFW87_01605 [Pseudomonadota bacterium]